MKKLTKQEIIEMFQERYNRDISKRLIMKVRDNEGNPLAPERYSYALYFTEYGMRTRVAFYPSTVGCQFLK